MRAGFTLAAPSRRFILAGMQPAAAVLAPALVLALAPLWGTANAAGETDATAGAAKPAATAPVGTERLLLAGSDLLKGAFAETLGAAARAAAEKPLDVTFMLDGSLMGEKYLRQNRADAALLFLPAAGTVPEIKRGSWIATPVAFQAAVVIVNKLNPLEQIATPMLAGVFSHQQPVSIKGWREVSPDVKNDLQIIPIVARAGLVPALFRARALGGREYRNTVIFPDSARDVEQRVGASASALGVIPLPPAGGDTNVRVVAVVSPRTGAAYLPTPANLYNGDYPLAVTLHLVFPRAKSERVAPLLKALQADATSANFEKQGLVPVEKELRKNLLQTLDTRR